MISRRAACSSRRDPRRCAGRPVARLRPAAADAGRVLRFDRVGKRHARQHRRLMVSCAAAVREPSTTYRSRRGKGLSHLTGRALLDFYKYRGSAAPDALAAETSRRGQELWRIGGLDRSPTLKAIRGERGDRWVFSTAATLQTAKLAASKGQKWSTHACASPTHDGHWDHVGRTAFKELIEQLKFPSGAEQPRHEWTSRSYAVVIYERGGVRIGIIGQALHYTAIANRVEDPELVVGIREDDLRKQEKRSPGRGRVSYCCRTMASNLDRKMASGVNGSTSPHGEHPRRRCRGRGRQDAAGVPAATASRLAARLDVRGGQVRISATS